MNDLQQTLADFRGTVRLFPLPNLVFFPQVVQPLHIFEPRYRQMTAQALETDRLIALALLKSGWEEDYDGKPPIHSIACLGRVIAEQKFDDGRFNLLLRGISRVRITEELVTDEPFRIAKAELITESPLHVSESSRLREKLKQQVLPRFSESAQVQLKELFTGEIPLGGLSDILSFALPLSACQKQELLEAIRVEHRVERLMELIEALPGPAPSGPRRFPPGFSSN